MRSLIVFVCAVALAIAGCAKVGTLDRPAPLFGEKAKAHYQAEKAAEAAAKSKKDDNGEPEPLPETAEAPTPANAVTAPQPDQAPEPTLPPVAPQ